MHFSTFTTCLALMSTTGWAQYVLEDDYMAGNFFDHFSFFDSADPTHGFVSYQDLTSAQSRGLIEGTSGNIQLKVDSTNVTPGGRPSVRLTSNKAYNSGLVILDLEHMPFGCGTWPAFWMVGPNWPNEGEIDIIEGVNLQTANDMTLHTGPGCSITNNGAFSGSISFSSCESGNGNNNGCQIQTPNTQTYGAGFNAIGGGVYATDYTSSSISIWFFPRGAIPADITSGNPNPSSWGKPLSQFQGGCDIASSFKNQQIVFDTTFCGDWAGNVWGQSGCASNGNTCNDFVANNPSAFQNAFWSIRGLKVYQNNGGSEPAPAPAPPAPKPAPTGPFWTGPVAVTPAAPKPTPTGPFWSGPIPANPPAPTTMTTAQGGWAPVVGPGGIIGARSPAERNATPDEVASPSADTPEALIERTDLDGSISVGPAVAEKHARHLRFHKRHAVARI